MVGALHANIAPRGAPLTATTVSAAFATAAVPAPLPATTISAAFATAAVLTTVAIAAPAVAT